jgi:Putative auto-transporter adhesin, head GIN domain
MHKLFQLTLLILIGLTLSGCSTVSQGVGQARGSGNITTETRAVGTFTAIEAADVGEVVITQGDVTSLTVTTYNNLQAIVLGAEQRVTLSGAGSYDGAALVSARATVDLSGLGDVVVNASERLDATLSGTGSIAYIGSPAVREQVSGLGSIRQRAP